MYLHSSTNDIRYSPLRLVLYSLLPSQIGLLCFTILSFIFVGAGVVHWTEATFPSSFFRSEMDTDLCDVAHFTEHGGGSSMALWPEGCSMSFFTGMYFIVVTATTVGFGDVSPMTPLARVMTMVILMLLLVIFPRQIKHLQYVVSQASKYDRRFIRSRHGHVVVCGDITFHSIRMFLSEYVK